MSIMSNFVLIKLVTLSKSVIKAIYASNYVARKERIKATFTKKPYWRITLITFILYSLINILINQSYFTFDVLINYQPSFLIPFLFFNLLVAVLIAISVSLIVLRIKELQHFSKASSMTAVGIFAGMITGACPGCFVGLLPAFLGIFGSTFNLAILPWHGIEIQIASSLLMVIAIAFLARDNTCKIKPKKSRKRAHDS
jgi:hypothetical protein